MRRAETRGNPRLGSESKAALKRRTSAWRQVHEVEAQKRLYYDPADYESSMPRMDTVQDFDSLLQALDNFDRRGGGW